MTFAQYIVFTEEMYKSVVNDNAEDFPKVAVVYPTVVIGVKFVSTLWIGVIRPWFHILGKMPELRMLLKMIYLSLPPSFLVV